MNDQLVIIDEKSTHECPKCLGYGVLDDRGFQLVGQPYFCTQPCPQCKGTGSLVYLDLKNDL